MVPLLVAEDSAGTYLDWGVVHISLANLLIIVLMLVVFVAALLVPFPRGELETPSPSDTDDWHPSTTDGNGTARSNGSGRTGARR
jgi:hypothetical protein